MYLQDGRVYASEMWRSLEMNFRRGGMKRIMEDNTLLGFGGDPGRWRKEC